MNGQCASAPVCAASAPAHRPERVRQCASALKDGARRARSLRIRRGVKSKISAPMLSAPVDGRP
jgi:hypothetical protein